MEKQGLDQDKTQTLSKQTYLKSLWSEMQGKIIQFRFCFMNTRNVNYMGTLHFSPLSDIKYCWLGGKLAN